MTVRRDSVAHPLIDDFLSFAAAIYQAELTVDGFVERAAAARARRRPETHVITGT